jgi:hypothetical protein
MFQLFKISVYLILLFILIQGFISIKNQISTNKSKEDFLDDTIEEETTEEKETTEEEETTEETTSDSTLRRISSTANSIIMDDKSYEDLISELTTTIQTNFDNLKENLDNQMDAAKKIVNESVTKVLKTKQSVQEDDTTNSSPPLSSDEAYATEDEEEEEDDEEDTSFSEGFVEEGMYDGITSPYCLNCSSL